jgi:hypothetical protein
LDAVGELCAFVAVAFLEVEDQLVVVAAGAVERDDQRDADDRGEDGDDRGDHSGGSSASASWISRFAFATFAACSVDVGGGRGRSDLVEQVGEPLVAFAAMKRRVRAGRKPWPRLVMTAFAADPFLCSY